MTPPPVAVLRTGLVTAVGHTAPAACAAIRAKLTNPFETQFVDSGGEWITGCVVDLAEEGDNAHKLATMAARAATECLADVPKQSWEAIPLLLCVSDKTRPGREPELDEQLYSEITQQLGVQFSMDSAVIPHGRASIATALLKARELLHQWNVPFVLIVGADSLLEWPTLGPYERDSRVLTSQNSNGFMPGEAAGAMLVGRPTGQPELLCTGLGFGVEPATIDSGLPLRADGLVQAVDGALKEAGCGLHDMDLRIADLSGEQYYFKEAALVMSRMLRQRKEAFELWHAAECTGEVGAAAGIVALAVADAAFRKAYAPGPHILFHASNDSGERAAAVLTYGAHA